MNRGKDRHISELRSKTPPVYTNSDFGLSELNISKKKRLTHHDSSPRNPKNKKKAKSSLKSSKNKIMNDTLFEYNKSLNESSKFNSNSLNRSLSKKKTRNSHSTTLTNFNTQANNSNLQDNYQLKVQINHLHQSISSQEKSLNSLQKKIFNEKSELTELYDKVEDKVKKDKKKAVNHSHDYSHNGSLRAKDYKEKEVITNKLAENEYYANGNHYSKKIISNSEDDDENEAETKRNSKSKSKSINVEKEDETSYRNISRLSNKVNNVVRADSLFGRRQDDSLTKTFDARKSVKPVKYESKYEHLIKKIEEGKELRESVSSLNGLKNIERKVSEKKVPKTLLSSASKFKYKNKINDLKSYIKDLTLKYDGEVNDLKHQIVKLNDENFRLKQKNLVLASKEENANHKGNVEALLNKKIKELHSMVEHKDNEIVSKENFYKGQINDINSKLYTLQVQMQKSEDFDRKFQDLNEQLHLKANEVHMTKKYYLEKLQTKIDDQVKQKKEWSRVYNELLTEIRTLKGEIDLLGYENRKLAVNSNSSSRKWKDDSDLHSTKKHLLD